MWSSCSILAAAALLADQAAAQVSANARATYYAPGIPTDAPVPGSYNDYLRPRVHFTPPRYFMNDPNGLHRGADALWHMYYQYNPLTPVAGNQHWGHATSEDLYTWENQKIALWPPNNYTYVFSGSAVLDPNNTSGFFPHQDNGVVAIYTLAEYPGGVQGVQYQAIAYSRDDGYTFEAYEANPVLDINSTQFRDPYVIWHEPSAQWVMTVAYAAEFVIAIFTSPDLKQWTHASNFTKHGHLGVQYECPNLLQMPMRGQEEPIWLLLISMNPGGPRGGSVSQYFPGHFNGTHFEPFDDAARFTDFGKDNYAAQFFHGVPANEPQIALGWASNWEYTQLVPTGLLEHGQFRSAMTVPRAHTIANISARGYDLISEIHNISAVVDSELAYNSSLGNGTIMTYFGHVDSGAIYFETNITNLTSSTRQGTANFTISSSLSGEYIQGGIKVAGEPGIWIDRGHIRGFDNPYFSDKFSEEGTFVPATASWDMSVVVDRSIIEIFLNGAQAAGTLTFFPTAPLDTLAIYVGGIDETASSSVAVWALRDTWAGQANANGTVVGNVTQLDVRQVRLTTLNADRI
ncbi:glycoside hydrolase family 32 protein [Pseudocercospora fijiensis CIRAD86]|uniref:Glycoside hydrolase family 32 protein n=1 Tax=Pseudocercospora fijiensis (strain CIRAD86) TaxID=383855 RepID=M2ZLU0_PSEFD|nr:glycoside hydrolase family 32 protein [Pseudocercospora fijiensis CIRAD86]EME80039.1 glycoside hydrolase family 32 protein [Pseudocercospora fijiensis CIRAD86]